jgi:hypothetical protein
LLRLGAPGWFVAGLLAFDIALAVLLIHQLAFNLVGLTTFVADVWNGGASVKAVLVAIVSALTYLSIKLPTIDLKRVTQAVLVGAGPYGWLVRASALFAIGVALAALYAIAPATIEQAVALGPMPPTTYVASLDNFPLTSETIAIEDGQHVIGLFVGAANIPPAYMVRITIAANRGDDSPAGDVLFHEIGFDSGLCRQQVWPNGAQVEFSCERTHFVGRHTIRFILGRYHASERHLASTAQLFLVVEIQNPQSQDLARYVAPLETV